MSTYRCLIQLNFGTWNRLCPVRTKYHSTHRFPTMDKVMHGTTKRTKPFMHGNSSDVDFQVEGVSTKLYPVLMKWERPRHIQRWEQHSRGSGDCEGLPEVDPNSKIVDMDLVKEFDSAPEVVKKVLSVGYQRKRKTTERIREDLVKEVRRHDYDVDSLESIISTITVSIRANQRDMYENLPHRNQAKKHCLKMQVDHRRVLLRKLRELDYKRFEWLLEKLNIAYRPRPFFFERIERKKHVERLTDLWCDEMKKYKLGLFENQLKEEQPKFLRSKAAKLRWILKEEEELGLVPSVKKEDVLECVKKAEEIEAEIRYAEEIERDFHVFRPEVKTEDEVFL